MPSPSPSLATTMVIVSGSLTRIVDGSTEMLWTTKSGRGGITSNVTPVVWLIPPLSPWMVNECVPIGAPSVVVTISRLLPVGVTGFVLQAAGYAPNAEQGDGAMLAIRTLYAIFPLTCYAIGSTLFLRFSFNEAEYGRVRREIDERSSRS